MGWGRYANGGVGTHRQKAHTPVPPKQVVCILLECFSEGQCKVNEKGFHDSHRGIYAYPRNLTLRRVVFSTLPYPEIDYANLGTL